MRTYRFFVNEDQLHEGEVRIVGADARQIRTVLRMNVGDEIEVIVGGCHYAARITNMAKDTVKAEILESLDPRTEPAVRITLAQALPKGDKLDWIIQKGTEIGVSEFVLIRSRRCVARLDSDRMALRVSRLRRIAKEAAEQSGRCIIPKIRGVVKFNELLREVGEYDPVLFCWEGKDSEILGNVISGLAEMHNILVMIGPEGGFTEEETAEAIRAGVKPVSLGNRVLRCETAALAASAIIVHETDRRAAVGTEPERSA